MGTTGYTDLVTRRPSAPRPAVPTIDWSTGRVDGPTAPVSSTPTPTVDNPTQTSSGPYVSAGTTQMRGLVDYLTDRSKRYKTDPAKDRKRAIVSAVADGLTALSNIYFAGQGATPAVTTPLSAVDSQRRERNRALLMQSEDALLRARQALADSQDRDARYTIERGRADRAEAMAVAAAQRDQALHEQKLRKAKADADTAEVYANTAESYRKSLTQRNNRLPAARGNGGSGQLPEYEYRGAYYRSKGAYEDAVSRDAIDKGIQVTYEDSYGVQRARPIAAVKADLDKWYKEHTSSAAPSSATSATPNNNKGVNYVPGSINK